MKETCKNTIDIYYEAMLARDARFDGKFYIGVKTTGIYCRPICPARPLKKNVEFFENRILAEKSGYRPCKRCRPEAAPLSPAWIGKSAVVQRAMRSLHCHQEQNFNEDKFAEKFGLTARHLRRLFVDEIGKTPKQLFFDQRLNFARQLLAESSLSISDICFSSGFHSVRRFNDAFKIRFKLKPSEVRRDKQSDPYCVTLFQSYRPPYDFDSLVQSYKRHKIGRLERFEDGNMSRYFNFENVLGEVVISKCPEKERLKLEIYHPNVACVFSTVQKIRKLFDLDADPVLIANSLELNPEIKRKLKKYPGLRLPSGWDPFEIAIGTILGQLVSVSMGNALMADLIDNLGKPTDILCDDHIVHLFPTPQEILDSDLSFLRTTGQRKKTLHTFCQAIVNNEISLESTQDTNAFVINVLRLKGIGPWTAEYIALKALRNTDAFPKTDLIIAREIKKIENLDPEQMRPWRGYLASLLWQLQPETK